MSEAPLNPLRLQCFNITASGRLSCSPRYRRHSANTFTAPFQPDAEKADASDTENAGVLGENGPCNRASCSAFGAVDALVVHAYASQSGRLQPDSGGSSPPAACALRWDQSRLLATVRRCVCCPWPAPRLRWCPPLLLGPCTTLGDKLDTCGSLCEREFTSLSSVLLAFCVRYAGIEGAMQRREGSMTQAPAPVLQAARLL